MIREKKARLKLRRWRFTDTDLHIVLEKNNGRKDNQKVKMERKGTV